MTVRTATLAARIRKARKRSKLSQGKFARKLGFSQQTLSAWENGNGLRGMVAAVILVRLPGLR